MMVESYKNLISYNNSMKSELAGYRFCLNAARLYFLIVSLSFLKAKQPKLAIANYNSYNSASKNIIDILFISKTARIGKL